MSRTTDFDREEILTKAMNLFWTKGYEGTTLKDLTKETGLLKGSLYNTFKSKENLFLLCLEKYGNYSSSFFYVEGDPKVYLKNFFSRLIEDSAKKDNLKGCLIMNTCLDLANTNTPSAKRSQELFTAIELNFDKVVKHLLNDSKQKTHKHTTSLITAAFSIREISKFKKDKKFLKQIANNALQELDIII